MQNFKNQSIPSSLDEFKAEAKHLKKAESFQKLGHAQNALAIRYGYKNFVAIRPAILALENANKKKESFKINAEVNSKTNPSDTVVPEPHTSFYDELPSEKVITMKELREYIKDSLEYSDPNDFFGVLASSNISLGEGWKPVVDDEFFNTDDEAVAHELAIGEWYEEIKNCTDDTRIIERFDEDGDLLSYKIYKE